GRRGPSIQDLAGRDYPLRRRSTGMASRRNPSGPTAGSATTFARPPPARRATRRTPAPDRQFRIVPAGRWDATRLLLIGPAERSRSRVSSPSSLGKSAIVPGCCENVTGSLDGALRSIALRVVTRRGYNRRRAATSP